MKTAVVSACSLALIIVAACSSSDPSPARGAPSGTSTTGDGGATTGGGASATTGGSSAVDGGDTSTPAVAAARACADLASAFCAKLERCSAFALSVSYSDKASCETRFALGCGPTFSAPGTSATPEKTATCAASVGALACGDVLAGNLGTACTVTAGALANGTACTEDAQCVSTFCARAPTDACGKCAPPTTAGGACVSSTCSRGTVCPKGATKCITSVRGAVGAACTVQEECDLANAVGCNTLSKKCIALALTPAGGQCGLNGNTFNVCAKSGACSSALSGTCSGAAADGATCSDADTGPHCLAPARCVNAKCIVTDPTSCK